MNFILNIDTAVTSASVCLSAEGKNIALKSNPETKDSAAWIHTAIQQLMQDAGITLQQLSAIALSAGPGSYTGLRVGMATAKGLCFALKKPLITINTLQMMAAAAVEGGINTELICPMIDARRMEVFTALYNQQLEEVLPSKAIILEAQTFVELLNEKRITFLGNGSPKFKNSTTHPNADFTSLTVNASHITVLAYMQWVKGNFADLAYAEPFYGKEFYSPAHNK